MLQVTLPTTGIYASFPFHSVNNAFERVHSILIF